MPRGPEGALKTVIPMTLATATNTNEAAEKKEEDEDENAAKEAAEGAPAAAGVAAEGTTTAGAPVVKIDEAKIIDTMLALALKNYLLCSEIAYLFSIFSIIDANINTF